MLYLELVWVAVSLCSYGWFEHMIIAYGTCTTNADSVKSMCYFEELHDIGSFSSVL